MGFISDFLTFNLLLFIPIHTIMMVYLYDTIFGRGYSPINRLGYSLPDTEKEIFIKARDDQKQKFKQWGLMFSFLLFLFLNISMYYSDSEISNSLLKFTVQNYFLIATVLTSIVYTSYGSIMILKPPEIRAIISVMKTLSYDPEAERKGISDLRKIEKLQVYDYHIVIKSFIKKQYSHLTIPHQRPIVRLSLLSRGSLARGEVWSGSIATLLLNRTKVAREYLTGTFLTDLKISKLWVNESRKEKLTFIGGLGAIISVSINMLEVSLSNEDEISNFALIMLIPFSILFAIFMHNFFNLTTLNFDRIDQILLDNEIDPINLKISEKADLLADLIEQKFPY